MSNVDKFLKDADEIVGGKVENDNDVILTLLKQIELELKDYEKYTEVYKKEAVMKVLSIVSRIEKLVNKD